jgi:hypothetical protein
MLKRTLFSFLLHECGSAEQQKTICWKKAAGLLVKGVKE